MESRVLGRSGIEVSSVGIGTNAFGARVDAETTREIVDQALDLGITFFDTSDTYGFGASEELLGASLGTRRDEVVIATKFGMDMKGVNGDDGGRRGSAAYVRTAVEASLRRLGTDHIDLYQLHTPDPATPIEETLGAMHALVEEGLVRAIGCSNFKGWQVVDADWTAREHGFSRFVTAQNEYSLYNRTAEVELVPALEHLGLGLLPYFPLAYGLLTGKYRRGESAPTGTRLAADRMRTRYESADWDRVEALERFAAERDRSPLELAIGGLAAQPCVTSVIAGVSRPEQVAANVAAAAWLPSTADLVELAEIGAQTQSYTTFAPTRR